MNTFPNQNIPCKGNFAPSAKNVQAILAYRKAGFNPTEDIPSWFVADYEETLVMSKELPAKTR